MRNRWQLLFFSLSALALIVISIHATLPKAHAQVAGVQDVCQMPPADIVVVMDTSHSMGSGKLLDAKAAAIAFSRIIRDNPNSRIALASFDTSGRVNLGFTRDYADFEREVNGLDKVNDIGTCLECVFDKTGGNNNNDVKRLFANNQYTTWVDGSTGHRNRRIVLLLTDGNINRWMQPDGDIVGSTGAGDERNARDQAEGAIRNISNTYKVEFWILQYGTSANNQNYLRSLVYNYYENKGLYELEGNTSVLISDFVIERSFGGNKLAAWYSLYAWRILGVTLTAHVFHDVNQSGIFNPGEPGLPGWSATLSRDYGVLDYSQWWRTPVINVPRSYSSPPTDAAGATEFKWLCDGAYTLSVLTHENYRYIQNQNLKPPATNPMTVIIKASNQIADQGYTRDFGFVPQSELTPPGTHSISGHVYIDTDSDGTEDTGEPAYSGTVTMQLTPSAGSTTSGNYTISDIPDGTYSLKLASINGYDPVFPPSGYAVTFAGSMCSVEGTTSFTCTDGNITDLNFGIIRADSVTWIQVAGSDMRNDSDNFSSLIPATAQCGAGGNVMIRNGNGNTPGIIFSPGTNDFGSGTASSTNWIVNGSTYRSNSSNGLRTSYENMRKTLAQNGVQLSNLNSICGGDLSNCTITDAAISNQAYTTDDGIDTTDDDLTLTSSTNITTKKTVILVNGDLMIKQNITVSPGAFLMFVVKGDIKVDPAVRNNGAAACAGSNGIATQLQGVFSTGGNFVAQSSAVCPDTVDKQLNIAGSVVTDADMTGGGILFNHRDLCAANAQYPSLTIQPRLDFLLSAPAYIMRPSTTWQEVAP